jgi:hypothetical protein
MNNDWTGCEGSGRGLILRYRKYFLKRLKKHEIFWNQDLPNVKVKLKIAPLHAVQTYMGNSGIAPRILNLGARGNEWSTSDSGRFTPEKEHRYPLHTRLDGPQSRSWHFEKEKNLLPLSAFFRTPGHPACSLVAIPSTHPRIPNMKKSRNKDCDIRSDCD